MPAANRDLMRAINRFKILQTIRDQQSISRIEISRHTGLSPASVTGITADLIAEGLLIERETGLSEGGRRPILLALNPEGAFTLGLYLSIQGIRTVIVNLEAAILAEHTLPLEIRDYTPEEITDKIAQAAHACIWQAGLAKKQISGVGIAIPGLVDAQSGIIHFLPNYRWTRVNLRDLVQQRLDHPTYIENSANALALAEQWFGEGRGIDNFIVITLEHGVGAGIVIGGQLYRGSKGTAGEFGHMIVCADGPLCRCGQQGCLEAIAGNRAIVLAARQAAAAGLWHPADPQTLTIEEVLEAARRGEHCLVEIYGQAGKMLGVGLVNLIRLFNPAKILISGKGTEAGDLLFKPLQETLDVYLEKTLNSDTVITIQQWDSKNYARGAGALVLQEIYKSPAHRIIPVI